MRRSSIKEAVWDKTFQPVQKQMTRTFHFELTSPLFGGGAESWKLDKTSPIKTQGIKGQLRFWWRTFHFDQDHKHLLHQENALWGGKTVNAKNEIIRVKSQVSLAVFFKEKPVWNTVKGDFYEGRFRGLSKDNILAPYVLFPVTEKIKNTEEIKLLEKGSFDLEITYPSVHETEILNTLKLWVLFGGVGARTRRGCGSLYCEELLKDFHTGSDISAFVQALNNTATVKAGFSPYPVLSGGRLFGKQENNPVPIKTLQDRYAEFRQARTPPTGSNPRPGRSYWPEPDAIRLVLEKHAPLHEPKHLDKIWFPRAAFGLPILTKFNTQDNGRGDPPDNPISLEPQGKKRWPSPVFLKVTKLAEGRWLKLVLVLNHKTPELKLQRHNLEASAKPDNVQGKFMIMDPEHPEFALKGRSIYKALADHLKLEEWL